LQQSEDEVRVHGLGAAMNRAVKLALLVKEKGGGMYELSPTTSTVALLDDYEPLTEDLMPITLVRYNSAIHIRIRRNANNPLVGNSKTNNSNTKTSSAPASSTSTSTTTKPPQSTPSKAKAKTSTYSTATSTSTSTPTSSKKRKSRKENNSNNNKK